MLEELFFKETFQDEINIIFRVLEHNTNKKYCKKCMVIALIKWRDIQYVIDMT